MDIDCTLWDRTLANITGAFGVPERMIMVEEWWSSVQKGVTYFKHRSLHKYTRLGRGQDRVEIKSMIDLVLVKRDMLQYVEDVREKKGVG